MVAVQILDQLRQQADVLLQADALAGFDEVRAAHAAEFRVVQQQIGQLAALLHHVDAGQAGDAYFPRTTRAPLVSCSGLAPAWRSCGR
jgi:hypothetical protein